jgi:hypothetical protein
VTIAVCYVSPEGVVLGADSTSTWLPPDGGPPHYLNHGQKIFEIGEGSTLGIVTWGLGGLATGSHRSEAAKLADSLAAKPAASVTEVTERFVDQFWPNYTSSLKQRIDLCKALANKKPYSAQVTQPGARTQQEEAQLQSLSRNLKVGFCIGGYLLPGRTPEACEVLFDPLKDKPKPQSVPVYDPAFWGVPNMIHRLMLGADPRLVKRIIGTGKWNGTEAELVAQLRHYALAQPPLPIRDAIDFVHTCIYSTIRALKFSSIPQACGGPVEVAVITVDRTFRWVKHKPLSSAIHDGDV